MSSPITSWTWPHSPITTAFAVAITLSAAAVGIHFVQYRLDFKRLVDSHPLSAIPETILTYFKHGTLKAPPFHMLFGTIPGLAEILNTAPSDSHPTVPMTMLYRKYGLGPLFFLDNWPVTSFRQIVINDPGVAAQITQEPSLPKDPIIRKTLLHILGPTSMFFTEGAEWRRSRQLFKPGFAVAHLMTLIPSVVDDVLIFRDILAKYAESEETFSMERATAQLTIDVMGHVILDHDLHSQTTDNEFVAAFHKVVSWTPSTSNTEILAKLNPAMPIMHWYYGRRMDNYLRRVLDARYKLRNTSSTMRHGPKPMIDLALEEYANNSEQDDSKLSTGTGITFEQYAIDQIKTFMLAGYDTTASTISYVYYLLHHHPESLDKARQEFGEVFGTNLAATADLIKKDPRLLNKLPYTTAIIKETLRLFPPATTARAGNSKLVLDGHSYPTNGFMLWINTNTIHRRADLFPSPDDFIPERFLPAPNNWPAQTQIPKNAFRPFEKGPRACIGQEFAMLELKIILALTLRDFDVKECYEEWDRKLGREKPGQMLGGKRGAFGYRAYQVMEASAKPCDGMPVRVRKRL